jgi:hypothetical protein
MHFFQQGGVTAPHRARVTQSTLSPPSLGRLISKRIEFHLNLHLHHCKLLACGCDTKQFFMVPVPGNARNLNATRKHFLAYVRNLEK